MTHHERNVCNLQALTTGTDVDDDDDDDERMNFNVV